MRARMGFTLVEILIATLILAVAITAALQVSTSTLRMGAQSQFTLWAAKDVQEYYLEYFRSLSFDSVAPVSGLACPAVGGVALPVLDPNSPPKDRLPPPASGNQCQYWVETVDVNLKRVTIQVRWTDPDNRARSSNISTLITRDGITNAT